MSDENQGGDNIRRMDEVLRRMFERVMLDGHSMTHEEQRGVLAIAIHFATMFDTMSAAVGHALGNHEGLLKRGECKFIDSKMTHLVSHMDSPAPMRIMSGDVSEAEIEGIRAILTGIRAGESEDSLMAKALLMALQVPSDKRKVM